MKGFIRQACAVFLIQMVSAVRNVLDPYLIHESPSWSPLQRKGLYETLVCYPGLFAALAIVRHPMQKLQRNQWF